MKTKKIILLFLIFIVVLTSACTSNPLGKADIKVNGYTEASSRLQDPTPVTLHISADNVGDADAKEVTVDVNYYSQGKLFCSETVSLGSVKARDHSSKTTLMLCHFPKTVTNENSELKFENLQLKL
jgi:hypothetical protein